MSEQLTIEVPDRIAHQAMHTAEKTKRPVEKVLVDWLEHAVTDLPVDELADEEVLALTEAKLSDEQQRRMNELFEKAREDDLIGTERMELDQIMRLYEHGLLRKSQALRSAVQRGLVEPLHS